MTPLVLASASRVRLHLLASAGVDVIADAATVDEDEVKRALKAEGADTARAAETLAELKALRISARRPGSYVLGADQMLVCEGAWFDKPPDLPAACSQLLSLKGRMHELVCGAVIVRDGVRVWHTVDRARLTMRDFSDAFLEDYLSSVGEDALRSVGGYQLEGRGAQLFARVDGDFFTVLGLPLLPVLGYLRQAGLLVA
ncbi:MAG: Maf family protein [Rhodospirillaceae bacterium]|nr:Maf family protein [Rhodospirillaceae bacterium]